MKIEKRLKKNIAELERVFQDCGDIVAREMSAGSKLTVYITYIDGMADRDYIENQLIKNLILRYCTHTQISVPHFSDIIDTIKEFGISSADISEIGDLVSAEEAMMSGDCVILAEGSARGIILSSKGWANRGISEPEMEKALQGSKEAFTETMRMNTALIRRRIRDTKLKIKQLQCGRRSKTDIALVYLDDVVRKGILNEALRRIGEIDIDAVLDSGYIEQLIEEDIYSPFPQTQVTERPDKAASAVLEGRIAIIVDNSPFAILIPATFNMFFQSSEDYYQKFGMMSFLRILRYAAGFASVTLSGMYIALTVYNTSMLPPQLTLKIAASRMSIPFPAVVEVIIMEIAFELLREAGVRLPGPIGGTLGIVGGLIMGQAAVEAGIVSPVVVIVVALAGIASFSIPQQSLVNGFRLSKFIIIFSSAVLGLFGFITGVLVILIHIVSLRSFGLPYMYPLGCSDLGVEGDMKDALIKAPLHKMVDRPFLANPAQRRRMKPRKE